jgi:hypothetical protein
MKRTVYRDSTTGRFVSRSTWTRSHAQGGMRYKRSTVTGHAARAAKRPAREEDLEDWIDAHEDEPQEEITGGFDTGKGKKK